MNILAQKDIDRFWGKVDKECSQVFYNGSRCWEWIAGRFDDGYGAFSIGGNNCRAHRVSWTLIHGELPSEKPHILHHCDNRLCVNPSHLWIGTNDDNMKDRNEKGRQARGEAQGLAKLNKEKIAEIRRRYGFRGKDGESLRTLAEEYGVHSSVISDIVSYKTWK